jgi:hypothetical protein
MLSNMRSVAIWKIAAALMIAVIALVTVVLFPWFLGILVIIVVLAAALRPTKTVTIWDHKKRAMEGRESDDWLEEWHDDMRRWQIGPYEQRN